MLRIERIEDPDRLDDLRQEWAELLAESAADHVFLTWEWLRTWWRHLGGERRRLHVLAARSEGRLVGLAPLARRPAFAGLLPRLEFLGTGTAGSDYLDVIVRKGHETEVLAAFSGEVSRGGLSLDLRQLRDGAGVAARLRTGLAGLGWTARLEMTDACPYVPLASHTWDSYLASLGPEHRANVRRRLRRLERSGTVRLERAETEEQRRRWLSLLWTLHEERWRERGGSEALGPPAVRDFHDEMTRLALARGWLRLLALTLDGRPAAVLYGLLYRRTFSYYQMGWDARFADRSVGLAVLALAIRSAIGEGALEFDLLHGREAYKFLWTHETRRLSRLEAFPPTAHGRALRAALGVGRACRSLMRRGLGEALHRRLSRIRRLGLREAIRAQAIS